MRICIVGSGAAAQSLHIPAWSRLRGVELAAVVDIDIDRARQVGRRFGVEYYQHLEDIPPNHVEVVDICTPTLAHFPLAKAALSKGFHVITEKPICVKSAEGQILVDLAKQVERKLGVIQHFIYSKAVMRARRALQRDELGSDIVIELSFPVHYVNPEDWSARPEQGGLLLEHGIHPSYILNYLMGEPEQVTAIGEEPAEKRACSISAHLRRGDIRAVANLGPFGRYTLKISGTRKEFYARLVADKGVLLEPIVRPFVGQDAEQAPNRKPFGLNPYFLAGFRWAYRDFRESLSMVEGYLARGSNYMIRGMSAFDQQSLFEHFVSWIEGKDEFQSPGSLGVAAVRTIERIRASLTAHRTIR